MSNPPTVFISYRRDPSADLARYIYVELERMGADAFFDVEDINGGRFDATIEREIIARDHFLVILAPQTLESEWVQRELQTALTHGKNIIPLETGGFSFSQHVPPELDELKRYGGIPYDFKSPETTFRRLARALQLPTAATTTGTALPIDVPPTKSSRSFSVGAALTIVLIILVIAGLVIFGPRFFQQIAAAPTATQTPTTPAPSPTDEPTVTRTPTPTSEPTITPLSPSATPSPTDVPAPTNILPSVSITVPAVVLPNTTILISAWQNAHCIFTPDDGNIPFGFDTSTGNIQYSVKHKAGTTVSIVCEDALGRHVENQFAVSVVSIPTATFTNIPTTLTYTLVPFTATATSQPLILLPTLTTLTKSYPCQATIVFTTGAMLNQVRVTPQKNAPTRQPVQQGAIVSVLSKQRNDSLDWYQITFDSNTGWIPSEYIILSDTCPLK
ncbi:MAG: TIR domain-containing protein [Anaerolineaceae bacterium]|nr:TIR domain-containing protein [Anaerolineaceae bacterium]